MPLPLAIPVGYWLLGGATVATAWWVSPMGEPAREATARALSDAVSSDRATTTACHNCRPCPVCGQMGPNNNPDDIPDWVRDNRTPLDREVGLNGFRRTSLPPFQGARIYHHPEGGYVYRDNFHTGRGSHLERFDRRGRHIGEFCPLCGRQTGPADPNKRIDV